VNQAAGIVNAAAAVQAAKASFAHCLEELLKNLKKYLKL
jgi:hypothetical protein